MVSIAVILSSNLVLRKTSSVGEGGWRGWGLCALIFFDIPHFPTRG